jgi:hypothetical protein
VELSQRASHQLLAVSFMFWLKADSRKLMALSEEGQHLCNPLSMVFFYPEEVQFTPQSAATVKGGGDFAQEHRCSPTSYGTSGLRP